MASSYSYWNEYQKEKKKVCELEETLALRDAEINALKQQISMMGTPAPVSNAPVVDTSKLTEYQMLISQLKARIAELEEQLYRDGRSDVDRKTAVHTRVIEAINRAFED